MTEEEKKEQERTQEGEEGIEIEIIGNLGSDINPEDAPKEEEVEEAEDAPDEERRNEEYKAGRMLGLDINPEEATKEESIEAAEEVIIIKESEEEGEEEERHVCRRESDQEVLPRQTGQPTGDEGCTEDAGEPMLQATWSTIVPVSYTHLTLPTKA